MIDAEGVCLGDMGVKEGLLVAKRASLDLVEVSPQAKIPVCRLMDYGRYRFKHQKKNNQKRQSKTKVKEIKLRPVTDVGDYAIKLARAVSFLQAGHKVKVTLRFRGREMAHQEIGFGMVQKLLQDLVEHATVDQAPKMEGKQIHMLLTPVKK